MKNFKTFVTIFFAIFASTFSEAPKFNYNYYPGSHIKNSSIYNDLGGWLIQPIERWNLGQRSENLPSIKNLNHILKQFANQNCIIDTLNFQKIDINNIEVPLIIRNLMPGLLSYKRIASLNSIQYTQVMFPSDIKPFTLNNTEELPQCPFSQIFQNIHCNKVRFSDFVSKSRPWNCEVNMYLFPHPDTFSWMLGMGNLPETILYRERSLDPK